MPSSNVCWGLDIGAGAIKAIKLERDGDAVSVGDFVVIPHKRVLTTPDLDEADALRVALGALMAEYGEAMKKDHVAVSIAGHSSFCRFAKLPPVEPKEVPNLVKFEAVQQIPFPIEEVEWDYQVFASEDTPDVEAGIFAITKERINERLHLYGDLGLGPDTFTISPVAVYNAIAYDLEFTENTPGTIILDIGAAATDLIIAEGGKVWIRTFPLGGHHFTEVLAETFKLNYVKAEKLKREAETSKYKRHIFQALKPIFSDLVQDVQRSIGYYQDTHPDAKLERLIGLGSTFKLMGLRKLLSQQLKLEVFRMERFKRISVDGPGAADFEAASMTMATAYGLALQGLGLTPINANLMPVQTLRSAMWKRKAPWFAAAALIGVAGAGAAFIRPFIDSQNIPEISRQRAIQDVISTGNRLKSEWQSIQSEHQPEFPPQNVLHLFDGKGLQAMLLRDVHSMLADARDRAGSPDQAFSLHLFDTDFLPPDTEIPLRSAPAAAGGDDDGGRGGRRGGADRPTVQAGPRGAVRITLELDTVNPQGDPFFNDTILDWLRRGPDPQTRPYELVEVPRIEDVDKTTAGEPDTPGATQRPSRTPPRGARGQPGERSPFPTGAPGGAPQQPQRSQTGASLKDLAPLPDPDPFFPPDETVTRYRVTWTVQLLEAPPGADQDADQDDQLSRLTTPDHATERDA